MGGSNSSPHLIHMPQIEIYKTPLSLSRLFISILMFVDHFHFFSLLLTYEKNILPLIWVPTGYDGTIIVWSVCVLSALGFLANALGVLPPFARLLHWCVWLFFTHVFRVTMNGGDYILAIVLMFFIFLPVNSSYAIKKEEPEVDSRFARGFVYFLIFMYASSVMSKLTDSSWQNGDALIRSLIDGSIAKPWLLPVVNFLKQYPAIVKCLSWTTLILEFVVPFTFLLPLKNRLRKLGVGFMILLHLMMGYLLPLGIFSFVCMAIIFSLLPGEDLLPSKKKNFRPLTIVGILLMCLLAFGQVYANSRNLLKKTNLAEIKPTPSFLKGLRLNSVWSMYSDLQNSSKQLSLRVTSDGKQTYIPINHSILGYREYSMLNSLIFLKFKDDPDRDSKLNAILSKLPQSSCSSSPYQKIEWIVILMNSDQSYEVRKVHEIDCKKKSDGSS